MARGWGALTPLQFRQSIWKDINTGCACHFDSEGSLSLILFKAYLKQIEFRWFRNIWTFYIWLQLMNLLQVSSHYFFPPKNLLLVFGDWLCSQIKQLFLLSFRSKKRFQSRFARIQRTMSLPSLWTEGQLSGKSQRRGENRHSRKVLAKVINYEIFLWH